MSQERWRTVAYATLGAAILTVGVVIAWRQTPPDAMWKRSHTYARLASPGPLSSGHAPLAADCEACHDPGAGSTALRCAGCHVDEPAVMSKPQTRFHADMTSCVECHPEHGAAALPTTGELHEELVAVSVLLDPSAEAPSVAALDCVTCHGASEPHAGYFGDECLTCHSTTTWSVPGYVHPAEQSGHCGECHKPPPNHFNPMFSAQCTAMLGHGGAVSDCDGCHSTAGWDEILGAKWHRDTMSHRARREPSATRQRVHRQ